MTDVVDFNISSCYTLGKFAFFNVDNILVFVLLLLFSAGALFFRYKAIIGPSIVRLESEMRSLRITTTSHENEHQLQDEQHKSSDSILKLLEQIKNNLPKDNNVCDRCFISSGKVSSGWRMLHRAKLAALCLYDQNVKERLRILETRLLDLDTAESKTMAVLIKNVLSEEDPHITKLRPLLQEGLRIYYEDRDTYYEMLADWQNKAMWLTFLAILFIFMLLWIEESAFLFVAGGFGGLLSKLRSVQQKSDIPTEYGFSWSTLFLTPLIGAINGWAGVYLVLIMMKVDVFGNTITEALKDGRTCSFPALMVIAIIFGYSAGLFEKMITKIESYATKEKKKIEKSTPVDNDSDE
jgi:hypothetical protein